MTRAERRVAVSATFVIGALVLLFVAPGHLLDAGASPMSAGRSVVTGAAPSAPEHAIVERVSSSHISAAVKWAGTPPSVLVLTVATLWAFAAVRLDEAVRPATVAAIRRRGPPTP